MVAAMARWCNGAKIPTNVPVIMPETEIAPQNMAQGRDVIVTQMPNMFVLLQIISYSAAYLPQYA
jgi:hypothetical protein